jgi:hypothetical protein
MVPAFMGCQFMAVKNIVDFHAVPTVNTSEIVINVPDSTTLVPLEERLFDPNTLVITTVTGGAGTTLVAGVDYSFSDLNEFATSKAGVDVYQTLNIINVTYQGVDIFIQAGTLNQYGDNVLAEDVNDLQSQINSVGPFINANFSFDISASNQTLDLSSLSGEANGYRIKAKWTGGDGNFQLSIVIPTGYTLGGVAKATIEADLKGDGQGVLVLVKNGSDLEIEKYTDTDGGGWSGQYFKKYVDGTMEVSIDDTGSIGIGTNFTGAFPVPFKGAVPRISAIPTTRDNVAYGTGQGGSDNRSLTNWYIRVSLGSGTASQFCAEAFGRWTVAQIEVS